MIQEVWKVAKALVTLADKLEKYHTEIEKIREELRDLTIIVHGLAQDNKHTKEQIASEYARHLAEVELRLAKAGKALPPAKKTKKKGSKK